jgi:hypothetical protein
MDELIDLKVRRRRLAACGAGAWLHVVLAPGCMWCWRWCLCGAAGAWRLAAGAWQAAGAEAELPAAGPAGRAPTRTHTHTHTHTRTHNPHALAHAHPHTHPCAQLVGDDSAKTSRFAHALSRVLDDTDDGSLAHCAARTMGHLVKSGGAMTADIVEREVRVGGEAAWGLCAAAEQAELGLPAGLLPERLGLALCHGAGGGRPRAVRPRGRRLQQRALPGARPPPLPLPAFPRARATARATPPPAQVRRAIDWLHGRGELGSVEQRRYAAVLVLRELAEQAPAVFNVHVQAFIGAIWAALRDPRLHVREGAVAALNVGGARRGGWSWSCAPAACWQGAGCLPGCVPRWRAQLQLQLPQLTPPPPPTPHTPPATPLPPPRRRAWCWWSSARRGTACSGTTACTRPQCAA